MIGAILLVVILSMLATVSLSLAVQELESHRAAQDEAVARHLAEAGAGLVLRWFHDPSSVPTEAVRNLLARKHEHQDGSPSFFDANGRSQFTGTETRPDIVFNAARPADDRLLNDPASGWLRSLSSLGRIHALAVYGPTRPGLLCTVQVTASARGLTRTLAVQLGELALPPLQSAVEIGNQGPAPSDGTPQGVDAGTPLPVKVHWGDLVVNGGVRQEPTSGVRQTRWDYETMKREALRHGTYYARGQDGLLYRHGAIEPGLGVTVDDVFRSETVGEHHGLVFVDTLDQTPPRADNLGSLTVRTGYAEGVFILNAHVNFAPGGTGKSVPVLGPPSDAQAPAEAAVPAQLAGIHLRGVLVTPGDVTIDGQPRVHGAVVVGGKIAPATGSMARLEVWYDDDLRRRLIRGVPLVYQAPGTWLEKYGERRG